MLGSITEIICIPVLKKIFGCSSGGTFLPIICYKIFLFFLAFNSYSVLQLNMSLSSLSVCVCVLTDFSCLSKSDLLVQVIFIQNRWILTFGDIF